MKKEDGQVTKDRYKIVRVRKEECEPFIMDIHYAKRMPPITYAYGLYDRYGGIFGTGELVGIVTYGTPFSCTLRTGIAGKEYEKRVLELNRLCLLNNKKNEASMLVGASLKMLPKDFIVVSFADSGQNHHGCVYQATNFLYTGLSAKRSDYHMKGKENKHHQTLLQEFIGSEHRTKDMLDKYGDLMYRKERSRKHRYIIFTGNKRFKKQALKSLKYEIKPYPKRTE